MIMINVIKIIEEISFFKSLNINEIRQIASYCTVKVHSKNSILYYEGDDSTYISFLASGLAKVYKMDKFDNEIFLYHICKDNMITELSSLNDNIITCHSNISTVEESVILRIDFRMFKQEFIATNILTLELIEEIFQKTLQLQYIINRELVFDSIAKVAHFLSVNLDIFNKFKRHKVSVMLHMQPETLSRVLKKLKTSKIITTVGTKVIITDNAKLKAIFQEI